MDDANPRHRGRRRSRAILALIVGAVLVGGVLFVYSLVERPNPVPRGSDGSFAASSGG